MNTILQALRNRHQKRPAEPISTLIEERRKPLPNLPVEIWFKIFRIVIRPSLIVDLDFEPFKIEQARLCLADSFLSNAITVKRMVLESTRRLRGVCRSWKEAVDYLDAPNKWIPYTNSHKGSTHMDMHKCQKLLHSLPFGYRTNRGYSHPVFNLMIYADPIDLMRHGPISVTSLAEVTPFPDQIRVLNLRLYGCQVSKDLLKDIQIRHIPLTTLALATGCSDMLQTSLEILTLISLFMTIPEFDETRWNEHPSYFQWNFPNLRNLSWTERCRDGRHHVYEGHPLLLEVLRNHFNLIIALRIYPIPREVADKNSSLCWIKMPQLQALATNFYRLEGTDNKTNIHNCSTDIASNSVQYLVAVDTALVNPHRIVDELQKAISVCDMLRVVYLPGYPPERYQKHAKKGLESSNFNWWDTGAIHRLQMLCKERLIQVKHEEEAFRR
jgi:hypothetical protein